MNFRSILSLSFAASRKTLPAKRTQKVFPFQDPEKGEWKEVPAMLARRTYASACELEVELGCVERSGVGLAWTCGVIQRV